MAGDHSVPPLDLKSPVGNGDLQVSTVSLPHYTQDDPHPSETVVVDRGEEDLDAELEDDLEQFRRRYDTEAEARDGHRTTVEAVTPFLKTSS
jgi:hypothetical protein